MSVELTWFPKQMAGASAAEIAGLTRAAGLTRCNAIVRDNYPTPPGTLSKTLGPLLSAFASEGVACPIATTGWTPADLPEAEADLAALAEARVTNVRLAQFFSGGGFGKVGDVRQELADAERHLDAAADFAGKHGLRFIYQVHFKTLHPSPSSLWPAVKELPPDRVAVMLDPGNQTIEGHEDPERSLRLFGPDRIVGCGVKDLLWERGTDGVISHRFVPVGEGMCDWPNTLKKLKAGGFGGHLTFMPFYPVESRDALRGRLAEEVAYVREHAETAGLHCEA